MLVTYLEASRDLCETDSILFGAALAVCRIIGAKVSTAGRATGHNSAIPAWRRRIEERIAKARALIGRLICFRSGNNRPRIVRTVRMAFAGTNVSLSQPDITQKLTERIDDLKQRIAAWGKRIRRYTERSTRFNQNSLFQSDQKRLYESLERPMVSGTGPAPNQADTVAFWRGLWSEPVNHSEGPWTEVVASQCAGITPMDPVIITPDDVAEAESTHVKTAALSKSLNTSIKAHFLYPKLVILEETRKVIIVDIENKSNEEEIISFDLEYDFVDDILQDHILWLTLKSYELVAINVHMCKLIKIKCNNYAYYRIKQFGKVENNILLMSESGECLAIPFTAVELDSKIKEGEKEITISLEKLNISRSVVISQHTKIDLNGFNAYIETGKIILECSITGLSEMLSASVELEYVVPWVEECSNINVQVYGASSLPAHHELTEISNNSVSNKSSQDNLKVQLNLLIETALSHVEPTQYSELKLPIEPNDIVSILNAIPYNIKIGTLIIWLHNFIPSILEENPFYVDLFVKWTTERVFDLERSPYWPKIGLKFIQEVISVLENSIKTIAIRPTSLDDLDVLKDHVNYIMELKEKYRINMLLSELSSQNPTEVALIMLRRCYTEDLEDFLQNNLPSYASRHLFELDDMLQSFIESEAAMSGGSVDGIRLQMLLNAFRSTSNRLGCLLQVLKVLDVPWNNTIVDLAVTAAASAKKDFTVTDADGQLAQEIHKELNYAKLKVVLKKYNFPLTCTDYNLVLHKIIDSPLIDLTDLGVITSVLPTYANLSSILYIHKCLQNCETKQALNYFKQLKNKEKRKLLKTIINKFELIINGAKSNVKLERNYLDFLKGTQSVDDMQMTTLENLYHLKNSYDITISMNEIYKENCCENKLNTWIQSDGALASSGRGRCITHLVNKHLSRNSALLVQLRQTSTSQEVREFVECMLLSDPCDSNMTSILSSFKDGNNSKLLIESNNILSELVSKCNEEYLHYLIKRLSILNSLINTNIVLKNLSVAWKFHYIFLPISSVNALNDLIGFYCKLPTNENNLECEISNICNRSDFIPFRLISYYMAVVFEMEKSSCEHLLKLRDILARKMLTKIVASQNLDNALVTILLIILTNFEVTEDKMWVLETLRGQSDSFAPSVIYYLSASVTRLIFGLDGILPGNIITYPPQYILKSKFNIDLSEVALPDSTEVTWDAKVVLFHVLRQYSNIELDRLFDLCRTLNVSSDDGLSLLLISLLTNWDIKYKLVDDDLGCPELKLLNDEKEIISKCFIIWESIQNRDFLRDVLNDFWKNGEVILHGCVVSINPYYYELYFCIYHLIFKATTDSRNIKQYYLLNFLKEYKRKSTPKQYEFELFSVKGMFPEIGYYRLPFHLFMRDDMWTHLKSEITLETYERWLPIAGILSLDNDLQTARDMICSNAVKQTMTSRTRNEGPEVNSKENEPWLLTSREEPLLRTAHRCVRHIANMEWAGACLFYVLQGCARGADQVAAAHLCFQFSQRWAALQPGNRAVRQMERLHSTLSTRHALHKIDWACEEFIRLSTEPAQLIHAMYLHPNFVDKIARHDVNRAANEIADKNGINISSIRIQILENILEKSQKERRSFPGLNTKELITAKYILKATCPKMGAIYLSRIAFDDESDFNKCKKLRAFQCLMSIVDPDTAVKVTNRVRDSLWSSLLELLYIVNLESIDMPWIVATFLQDKILAIHQLLQVASGNIEGLKIAAELAYRYGNFQIIHDIIPLLLRASLYEDIIPLLLKVFHPPNDNICTAWRAVLLTPFQRADYPITERQRKKCLNVLNLLPICPLIKDEDLIEIWKNCVRCKCLGLGCLVLPYMTSQTRQKLTELQKIDRRNLVISLKNLQAESYLVSGAMIVLENMGSKVYK
ncbi:unnamed protein product [Parnassius apollo]|uniref:(apollo) hypothetical protein n=1 Tax=Parnassius apollo TaxID=110799 RepID=A0A8S3WVB8_PARAO|nr:unnamed protein product [Parnassius apollo]